MSEIRINSDSDIWLLGCAQLTVMLVEREYMVVMWVLEQVSLIVADTILSVRFFNTSTPDMKKLKVDS